MPYACVKNCLGNFEYIDTSGKKLSVSGKAIIYGYNFFEISNGSEFYIARVKLGNNWGFIEKNGLFIKTNVVQNAIDIFLKIYTDMS